MARFTGVPSVPQTGLDEGTAQFMNAVKQNVELLIGSRGEIDNASRALLVGSITVSPPARPQLQSVSVRGAGFTISGAQVPSYTDYMALVSDVQRLANDLNSLRETVDTLIKQLRQ